MKGGNSSNNEFDFDKGNILKPTLDTLTEDGGHAFKTYITDLRELFLSCCEVMQQGLFSGILHRSSCISPR
jgi:hypothetical protein